MENLSGKDKAERPLAHWSCLESSLDFHSRERRFKSDMGYMVLRYGIHIVYKNGDEVEMWFSTESKREKEFFALKKSKAVDTLWRKYGPKEIWRK